MPTAPADVPGQTPDATLAAAAPDASARKDTRERKIVYICDWLPPDYGAVGQYSLLFARALAQAGAAVVLAGLTTGAERTEQEPQTRSETERDAHAHPDPGQLTIVRLHAGAYDKSSTLRRMAWTIATNVRLIVRLWRHLRWADEIVFTGSPPLFLHVIAPANLLLRKHLTYRITDFHPECTMALTARPALWIKLLYAVTLFWRRRVSSFEVLGHDQIQRLEAIAIPRARIRLKPDPSPVAIPPDTQPLPRPPGVEGKFLLLYSGNWGVAHDYETFVEAYRRHHSSGSGRLVLWLNAVGANVATVERAIRQHGLPFVMGTPVPLEQLASLLVTPDASLITLSDAFVGYVLPSKVHGCIACRKPVLFIGSVASDVHRLCSETMIADYIRVDTGDIDACTVALESLCDAIQRATPAHA